MILILSNASFHQSMDEVISWLRYYEADFIRINGLSDQEDFCLQVDLHQDDLRVGLRSIPWKEIKAVWFYRWNHYLNNGDLLLDPSISKYHSAFTKHFAITRDVISHYLFQRIQGAKWLGHFHTAGMNKLVVLKKAMELGIEVPATLVSNSPEAIRAFAQRKGAIITKSPWEMFQLIHNDYVYTNYTTEVKDLDELTEERISPSLVQEKLEKQFEIRCFYLDGAFYSMAIFSQQSDRTKVDFRQSTNDKLNRQIPYRLPASLEKKLSALCSCFGLQTASLDLVRTKDKRFVLLEINPVGQYGMTSKPCNYYLEKKIALYLIQHARNKKEFHQEQSGEDHSFSAAPALLKH